MNSLHIVEALAQRGIEIDRRQVQLRDVKEIGNFTAVVKVYKDVNAELPFTVVAENAEELEAAKAEAKAEAEAEAARLAAKAEAEAAADEDAAVTDAPTAEDETTEVATIEA